MTPSETEIAKACAVVDANADHRVDNKVMMTIVMMKMTIMKGPSDNDDDDDDYDYFHARVTLVSAAWSTQALSPPKTQRVTTC